MESQMNKFSQRKQITLFYHVYIWVELKIELLVFNMFMITERMNKVFRENIEFLFGRFECQDLCAIVVSDFTFATSLPNNYELLFLFSMFIN